MRTGFTGRTWIPDCNDGQVKSGCGLFRGPGDGESNKARFVYGADASISCEDGCWPWSAKQLLRVDDGPEE